MKKYLFSILLFVVLFFISATPAREELSINNRYAEYYINNTTQPNTAKITAVYQITPNGPQLLVPQGSASYPVNGGEAGYFRAPQTIYFPMRVVYSCTTSDVTFQLSIDPCDVPAESTWGFNTSGSHDFEYAQFWEGGGLLLLTEVH